MARVTMGGGESDIWDFAVNCQDVDHRHQCLLMIEAWGEGRQTDSTSKVGLSFHRRHGSKPHSSGLSVDWGGGAGGGGEREVCEEGE